MALSGPPGSGKTTLAQVAHPDLVVQPFHGETAVEDVIGRYVPTPDGRFVWRDGPLTIAIRQGRPYLADELPRAPRETQAVLLPVCDHQRRLLLPSDDGVGEMTEVIARPGFCVVLAFNPGSGEGLIEALHSRMSITVDVPSHYQVAEELGVDHRLVRAAEALYDANRVSVAQAGPAADQWVPSIRELLHAHRLMTVHHLSVMFAAAALVSACPDVLRRTQIAEVLGDQLPDSPDPAGLIAAHPMTRNPGLQHLSTA